MRPALARHDALVRGVVEGHRGTVVKLTGDGVYAAFADPIDAITASLEMQLALADRAIEQIATSVAEGHGCRAAVSIDIGEPVLANDAGLALRAGELLTELGHAVIPTFRSFGSDDFAVYCEHVRGLMVFVGTGAENGGLHDASYLPDDAYVATVADALIAGYCAALAP